ncbi:MAG: translocation/assembly module TamB domain-containing protein [Ferruginibacter sp.]
MHVFKAVIKAADLDPAKLDLYALVDSIKLNVKDKSYGFDSIMAKATTADNIHDVVFRSPFVDVNAKGAFDYNKIGASIIQYINKYYAIAPQTLQHFTSQQIAFDGVIKNHPFITDMEPGLDYEDIHFKGNYASSGGDSALNINLTAPRFIYNDYSIDSAKINIVSSNNQITYAANADAFKLSKKTFYATSIKGDLANDSLNIVALTKDERKRDWYGISAAVTDNNKQYTISLKDAILLNYEKWNVPDDNKITYSNQGVLVNDFLLEKNKSKILIGSQQKTINSPIDITIENFDIKNIASIISSDTLLAAGIINGKIEVSGFDKTLPAFTGNIAINQFQFLQQPVGDVKFYAQAKDENSVTATVGVNGKDNVLNAKGNYYLDNTKNQFDANLDITKLNMATLQAFAGGTISRASGNINGKIALNGNFTEPHWNGDLNFDSAKFTIVKTGATYSINNQKIVFNYPVIAFHDFTILDTAKNYLSLDGSITAQSLSDYDLSLNMYAQNFSIVNTAKAIDNQMYGKATVNTDFNISGSLKAPDIEGDISLNKKSDVTLVLPEQNIDKDAANTVVRFVDMDTFKIAAKPGFVPVVEQKNDLAQFLNYNLNININKDAALTVIVDPSSGDELKVQGDAQLNAGVDPGGNIVLAGSYNLNKGYYIMNYQFLQRQFNLLDSSTIIFSGSPMNAQVDITAEYIANTAPGDLLENEISGLDPKTANTFNQKIPFRVLLHLKGSIKKPDISFDIQLPDESSNVPISSEMRTTIENKLAQVRTDVAVTNKEVFSLLLLGHFVGEQSTDFFKGNGTSTDEVLKESVSSFLSTALNQVTSDLIKGVDVNLNLNSYQDYSTGNAEERTDLDVAVSKNFMNDRLTITAGKDFGVEGQDPAARTESQNTSAVPDITINYKLSESGKYSVRAYKKDQYEVTLDGYITQTGVGFVFTMDYDKFKELFENKKEKEALTKHE